MDNESELRMRAARGDPEALRQLEKERQRMRIQVEAARAAWGFRPALKTILTGSEMEGIDPESVSLEEMDLVLEQMERGLDA